jgi:1-aminocyclopropane-1-carboxylate deaminase
MDWSLSHIVQNEFITQINGISLTIKREDQLHPMISGNKFRKLKYNFCNADLSKYKGIITFGGAYSNHLVATAAAGNLMGISTHGFVRGEELEFNERNPSLAFCERNGMQLHFLSRADYRKKEEASKVQAFLNQGNYFLLPEGGTNPLAIKGCAEILTPSDKVFDTICCSVGTGGTFMGLINSAEPHQHLLGFQAVNDSSVSQWIAKNAGPSQAQTLLGDHLYGGYGKATDELVEFMNAFYKEYKILLDPVYTGKLLFGIFALIKQKKWCWGKEVLIIHTGGIQGIKGFNLQQTQQGKVCIDIP